MKNVKKNENISNISINGYNNCLFIFECFDSYSIYLYHSFNNDCFDSQKSFNKTNMISFIQESFNFFHINVEFLNN